MRVPGARTIQSLLGRATKTLSAAANTLTGRGRREAIKKRLRRLPEEADFDEPPADPSD
jgi:hypothetical protein